METAVEQTQTSAPEAEPPDLETGLPLIVKLRPVINLSEDQFLAFCQINDLVRIERNAQGDLLLMPPAGGETSSREARIIMQLTLWATQDGTGTAFSSAGGFNLPNGAMRAPDAAWMLRSRLDQLTPEEREKFVPGCPDFVVELRSPSDTLRDQRDKMQEYLDNGARLGWLIDRKPRHVYVYRPDAPVERLDNPDTISGDPVLPGFVLDLREIW